MDVLWKRNDVNFDGQLVKMSLAHGIWHMAHGTWQGLLNFQNQNSIFFILEIYFIFKVGRCRVPCAKVGFIASEPA